MTGSQGNSLVFITYICEALWANMGQIYKKDKIIQAHPIESAVSLFLPITKRRFILVTWNYFQISYSFFFIFFHHMSLSLDFIKIQAFIVQIFTK